VFSVCAFPVEAAATRFRLAQFVAPLTQRGIELTISPFLNRRQFKTLYCPGGVVGKAGGMALPFLRRLGEVLTARKYDAVIVQREAMLFGPGVVEWLITKIGKRPIVLDLDDATYVPYISPTYGRIGSFLKFFGKTDNLIKRSSVVVCGNRSIARYVESKGTEAVVVPTVVNLKEFTPRSASDSGSTLTLGWIGTHSTFPFLESIFPVLERLAAKHIFRLKIVGARIKDLSLTGIEVERLEWDLEREVEDFRSLDIGLYPVSLSKSANEEWILGKSGFKAVQYMAVGVPFVMTPVGVCADMGEPGLTHFNAESTEDWYNSLDKLMSSQDLRRVMGAAGRRYALLNYGLDEQADKLANVIRKVTLR
jgi:glycosyltransferase involved in cell wall biosynthesis